MEVIPACEKLLREDEAFLGTLDRCEPALGGAAI
jgi:hypothetical protein